MTTLHRVTEATKKIIVGLGIGIASIIFLVLFFRLIINLKNYYFPTPPPSPTVSFGKLPTPIFSVNNFQKKYTYILNTISGSLPELPDRATVYKLDQPQPSLLDFGNAKSTVANAGFTQDPTQVSDIEYQWKKSTPVNQTLLFDTVNLNFLLTSDTNYLLDQNVIAANFVPSENAAIQKATDFFQNLSSMPDDIDQSKTKVTYYTVQNGNLILSDSFTNREVVTVDFYQKDVNKLPVFYPDYPDSTVHAIIVSGTNDSYIAQAQYFHKNINLDESATYPLKTAQEAFDELKANNGHIAHYDTPEKNVVIRDAFLAYYIDKDASQKYLYPIIVFQGDNNFYGFVSAIRDEWLGN